jgi:DNA-binding NtrC family response regulator
MALSSASSSPATDRPVQQPVILLIDSDADFRNALAENLRDDGHTVEEYGRPQEAAPLAEFCAVRALVIGHQSSPHQGLAFADEFHSRYPKVPIVLLSAYWSQNMQTQAAKRTFVNLRTKPVDYEDLHSLLCPSTELAPPQAPDTLPHQTGPA